ncbi:thioredoxin family protein [Desulfonatronospira sp. MSAO_Bac3]|uniref:thioredoxin family protein n=1 Tax=Desulfonatronospira sp. MSAO_Bac3 TaxID=2293857 RepID=UPI000FEF3100|nr:thioredoxin family protein [Desulfonatronospira sp. MSAO_Bac3]RQD77133.1 MAG: thioredoxin [Desulfonatronospira sp. MSAO_Bac3]
MQALKEDRHGLDSRLKVLAFEIESPRNLPSWAAGVRGVPTFIIFKDGQEVDRLVATGRDDIVARLSQWFTANS